MGGNVGWRYVAGSSCGSVRFDASTLLDMGEIRRRFEV